MHSIDKSLLWLLSAGFRTRPSIFKAWGSFGSKTCESVALLHLVILQSEMLIDFQTGVRGGWIARSVSLFLFVCCFLTLMGSFSNLALLISLPVPHTCHFSLLPSSLSLSLNSTKSFPGDCNGPRMKGRSGCEAAEICKCRINTPIGFAHSH